MREFYASYVGTLQSSIDRRSNPAKQVPLDHDRVCGLKVDISLPAIHRFLYGADTDVTREPLTPEFDYRWKLIKEDHFQRDAGLRETTKKWIAQHISKDDEGADWVLEPRSVIKKANLTVVAKFIWLLVFHFLSPIAADNILT